MTNTGTTGISADSSMDTWALQGEFIEVRQGGTVLDRGWVDTVAPDLGVLWIVSSATGIRRMLELEECEIQVLQEPPPGRTDPR